MPQLWSPLVFVWEACFALPSGTFFSLVGPCTIHETHRPLLFSKKNIKNGSHGTIHTFKNYFAIVFSVFNNKWYPNKPLISWD